jgi:anti-sigma regulatory factor (Ser/Thr protein kinase)
MTVLSLLDRGCDELEDARGVLRLRPDPSELARAREFAAAAADQFGLTGEDRDDFRLAASEAVANAIEHGLPCWDGAIHLWASERDGALMLCVRNGGDFIFEPPPQDPLAERGRGLTLIANLVDAVTLIKTDDHVQVELSKGRARGNG